MVSTHIRIQRISRTLTTIFLTYNTVPWPKELSVEQMRGYMDEMDERKSMQSHIRPAITRIFF